MKNSLLSIMILTLTSLGSQTALADPPGTNAPAPQVQRQADRPTREQVHQDLDQAIENNNYCYRMARRHLAQTVLRDDACRLVTQLDREFRQYQPNSPRWTEGLRARNRASLECARLDSGEGLSWLRNFVTSIRCGSFTQNPDGTIDNLGTEPHSLVSTVLEFLRGE